MAEVNLQDLLDLIRGHEIGYRGPDRPQNYDADQAQAYRLIRRGGHGPSRNPRTGGWLKAPWHPTAWKEYAVSLLGTDPDETGMTEDQFWRFFGVQK